MTPFTLDLLGGFRASLGPRTLAFSKKAQALLAYLALSPGRRHSRARLADLLWGDRPEDLARNSVRHALFEIRKPFGSGWAWFLAIDHEWVELLAAEVTVDALELQRLAAEGTLAALEQAARLCRGDLLEGHSLNEATLESLLIGERERCMSWASACWPRCWTHRSRRRRRTRPSRRESGSWRSTRCANRPIAPSCVCTQRKAGRRLRGASTSSARTH